MAVTLKTDLTKSTIADTALIGPTPVFVRAGGTTMFNNSGLVQFAPENLVEDSDDPGGATYVPTGSPAAVVTGRTAPDGTATATQFVLDDAQTFIGGTATHIPANYPIYQSFWIKKNTGSANAVMNWANTAGTGDGNWAIDFSLLTTETWTFIETGGGHASVTETTDFDLAGGQVGPWIRNVSGTDNLDFDIWHPQMNRGLVVQPYLENTLGSAAARLDGRFASHKYIGSSWQNRGYLSEGAKENLLKGSNDLTSASSYWTDGGAVGVQGAVAGLDGALTAWVSTDNAGSSEYIDQTHILSATDANVYIFSLFMKKTTGVTDLPMMFLDITGGGGVNGRMSCDTNDGTRNHRGGALGPTDSGVVDYGDWWQFWMTETNDNSAGNVNILCRAYPAADSNADGIEENAPTGSATFYQADLRLGSVPPLSIVPTIALPVTTVADNLSATHATNSPFSVIVKGTAPAVNGNQVMLQWDDGSDVDKVRIENQAGDLHVIFTTASSDVADLDLGTLTVGDEFEVAFRSADGDFAASLDGGAIVADALGTAPDGLTTIYYGHDRAVANHWDEHIKEVRAFDEGLANAVLQSPPPFNNPSGRGLLLGLRLGL